MSEALPDGRWGRRRTALEMNRSAARSVAAVSRRRLARKPRDPAWSMTFQSLVELLAQSVPEECSAQQLRATLDAATRMTRPSRPQVEMVHAGSVPALQLGPLNKGRVILYLHGGGYVCGSPWTHLGVLQQLQTACGASVLAPDYRLAPEAPYPAALEDAWSAYWWLLQQGVSPKSIIIGGDSAGGGLALALLIALRDANAPMPAGAACLSPWVDLAVTGNTIRLNAARDYINGPILRHTANMYAGDLDPRAGLISPLYADLAGLPPVLIQVGSDEVLLDDSRRIARRLREAGTPVEFELWESMVHVWHFFYLVEPRARAAIRCVGRFVRAHTPAEDDDGLADRDMAG